MIFLNNNNNCNPLKFITTYDGVWYDPRSIWSLAQLLRGNGDNRGERRGCDSKKQFS